MSDLFLGLDSSTQSLSAVVIDLATRRVVCEQSLNFDRDLPHYGTRDGVHRSADGREVHAPPLMWAEALDLLLARLRAAGLDLGAVRAVAGSGQQHGSVYLNERAQGVLAALDPAQPLAAQLGAIFSRATSPIWMDASTTTQCAEIRAALGGIAATAEATGSDAFERFTGPQIRKFFQTDPAGYAATRHIALVSSFMCSLLAGRVAPIDYGDGAGMNLMDIRHFTWHPGALAATAPDLMQKLPPLAPASQVAGPISRYFVERFGFRPDTRVAVWSGDNPCSVTGLGLVTPGARAISLGTSFTCFGTMAQCRVDVRGEGHVFGSPPGGYMTLICFKNGALARGRIRDQYGLDWAGFDAALAATSPGGRGGLMLPYFEPEIVPRVARAGVRRRNLDEQDAAANVRALVECQMLSLRLHAEWMGEPPQVIHATGGAAESTATLQIMADVHGCPVERTEVGKSAALGAALQAAQAWATERGTPAAWPDLVRGFTDPVAGSQVEPRLAATALYERMLQQFIKFEAEPNQ